MIFVGAETGAPPVVKAYDAETGTLLFERTVYEASFSGGVRVATADFTGDGFPDLAVGPGEGGGPRVRILDGKTGNEIPGPLGNFWAFGQGFKGGVEVAAADINGDNRPDLIVAAGKGGGPHVRVFDGVTGDAIMNFMAFHPDFRGGVSIGAADFNRDGKSELVIGAGPGGGPHVRTYEFATGKLLPGPLGDFFAYEPEFRGGVNVGTDWKAGDLTADFVADLVVAPGAGRAPDVKVYNGSTGQLHRSFPAFDSKVAAGVRVATAYVNDDAIADVVVATAKCVANQVRVLDGRHGKLLPAPMGQYTPFGPTNFNGITIAASNDPPPPDQVPPYSEQFTLSDVYDVDTANQAKIVASVAGINDNTEYQWDYDVSNTSGDLEHPGDLHSLMIGRFHLFVPDRSTIKSVINPAGWTSKINEFPDGSGQITWDSPQDNIPAQSGSTPPPPRRFTVISFPVPIVMGMAQVTDDSSSEETCAAGGVIVPGEQPKIYIIPREDINTPIDTLNVAKLENSFSWNPTTLQSSVKEPENGYDFIDFDSDRFRIIIKDTVKWNAKTQDGQVAYPYVYASISTSYLGSDVFFDSYNDNATQVSLVRSNLNIGYYWSDSHILVSNSIDDDYSDARYLSSDDTAPTGISFEKYGQKWIISDRTHMISLNSKVVIEYFQDQTNQIGLISKLAYVNPVKSVSVNITVTRNEDSAPVISETDARNKVKKSNEQYAQIGIFINVIGSSVINAPFGVNLGNGFDFHPSANAEGIYSLTTENRSLLSMNRLPLNSTTGQADAIELYFINYFANPTTGEKLQLARGQSYWNSGLILEDKLYADTVVISEELMTSFTIPHEIAHILLHTPIHYGGDDNQPSISANQNLLRGFTSTTDTIIATKRIWHDQQTYILGNPPLLTPKRPSLIK